MVADLRAFSECYAGGWIKHEMSCYKMVEEKKTWREARLACLAEPETNDSSLALIHTEEENNFLAKTFGIQTGHCSCVLQAYTSLVESGWR